MRHSLAMLRGGVLSRLLNPKQIDIASVDIEINNSLEELAGKIRDIREDWMDRIDYLDIVANKDIYIIPDDCSQIKMVERLDRDSSLPVVLRKQAYSKAWENDVVQYQRFDVVDLYVHLPDRKLRIIPKPESDAERSLRLTYQKRIPPLVNDKDYPDAFPDEIHEWLIPTALDRLRQYASVEVAKPQEFEGFRKEQTARLMRFLRPKESDQAPEWGDEDEFYMWH